jgi:hypothetical protein
LIDWVFPHGLSSQQFFCAWLGSCSTADMTDQPDRSQLFSSVGKLHYAFLLNSIAATGCLLYFLSHGFQTPGILDGYYEMQAHSLARGQLSITPGPLELFYHDASLYSGKYYFYWGLLPSILYLGLLQVLGRIGAHYVAAGALLFSMIYFFQRVVGLIVDASVDETADGRSVWRLAALPLLWFFLFNLPFSSPQTSWFFSGFTIYEQQIVFGLAFAVPALFFSLSGAARHNNSRICLASFLLSLAACTRGTWFVLAWISIPIAFLITVKFQKDEDRPFSFEAGHLWLAASALLLMALLLINYVRFDSILDFGLTRQNPQVYVYMRNQTRLFSPETRFWNLIFNMLSYYGSPTLIQYLGLGPKSSSVWERFAPSFFYFNPQFLLILALSPLALRNTLKHKPRLVLPMMLTGFTAVYMSFMAAAFGTMVIMRYFVESYYFLILFFCTIIMALLNYRYAFLIAIALLGVHLPANMTAFAKTQPELRLVNPDQNFEKIEVGSQASAPFFIERSVVWPKGRVSIESSKDFRRYNMIGIGPGPEGFLVAEDVSAAYIIPSRQQDLQTSEGRVILREIRSVSADGNILLFVDGRSVGRSQVKADRPVNVSFPVVSSLAEGSPCQVLMVYCPGREKYLAPRPLTRPALVFREIRLVGYDTNVRSNR